MSERKLVGSIDITPTWEESANLLLMLIQDGDARGKEFARSEIRRMGKLLDQLIAERKESK